MGKRILLLLFTCFSFAAAFTQGSNCKIISWNIRDLGKTKSEAEIATMAKVLRGYDVIAIQEVVAKDPSGAKAVARLAAALNRLGQQYDYRISAPTKSSSPHKSERYAFLWKTSTIKLRGRPKLMQAYAKTIEREPYIATFVWEQKAFRVVNVHALPRQQQPERELAQLRALPDDYADLPLFVLGDFNLVSHHTVFNPWIDRGYRLAIRQQPTTLRKSVEAGESPYFREADNMLVPAHQVHVLEAGTLDIVSFLAGNLTAANELSDHIPVYVIFDDFAHLERG